MPKKDSLTFQKKFPGYNIGLKSTYAKGILFFSVIAFAGMFSLFLEHFTDTQWFWFLLGEGLAAGIAMVGIKYLDYNARIHGLADLDTKWKPVRVVAHMGIIFILVLVVQKGITQIFSITMGVLLSLKGPELIFYYAFGAISEELFFRGFICRAIAGNKNNLCRGVFAIFISTIGFMAIHVSYYGNILEMSIVAGSGATLAIFYLYWKDLLANMLAHFFLNLIVVLILVIPTLVI